VNDLGPCVEVGPAALNPSAFPLRIVMAFWDFIKRLWKTEKPIPSPAPTPASAPLAETGDAITASVTGEAKAPGPRPEPTPVAKPQSAGSEPPPPQPIDFLPIGREDLVAGAEEVRRGTGWMWFGRRDIIPPVSDLRTKLIDRGMLTQGLLSAQELAEIHTIGEQYDKYANREKHIDVKAGQSADQAVEADRAARAALKTQKKAEAAERKKKRSEAVAHRKACDINFVGKGVSAQMNDRQSDAVKLESSTLPVLYSPADLAAALGLTIPRLRWLCFHTDVASRIHYIQFEVPKKSGGTRILSAPHRMLMAAQRWIFERILVKLPVEPAAHGFVRGRSTLSNARPHAAQGVLLNLDLENFFPSIGFARIRHLYRRLGYSGSVATLLALICTECPRRKVIYDGRTYYVATGKRGLPQGACTSPALSNQIARKLDRRITGLCQKLGVIYTRYADDLAFSAGKEFNAKVGYLLARVRHVAQNEGFAINSSKTRVKRANARQTVTGLVVNVQPSVPRDVLRRLRAILHRAKNEGLESQNRERRPDFRAWIEGMIAYVAMSRPDVGGKLRTLLSEIAG
jgi:RNA-directed DNA polymerase